jgi:hypothetical protein
MNEQIENLARQATEDCMGVKSINHKKFAELIIQECVKIAMSEMVTADELETEEPDERAYLLGNNGGILDAVGAIRLHFGV